MTVSSRLHFAAAWAVLCMATFGSSCKEEDPPFGKGEKQSAVSSEKICDEGGATYDQVGKSCVCPEGKQWQGSECVESPVAADVARVCKDGGGTWDEGKATCDCLDGEVWQDDQCQAVAESSNEQSCSATGGVWDTVQEACNCPDGTSWNESACSYDGAKSGSPKAQRIQEDCDQAGATWYGKEGYCHCEQGKVPIGGECLSLDGALTEEVCLQATFPGTWKAGRCRCGGNQVFSPARGGCIAPYKGSDVVLDQICESSLNNGRWDKNKKRCECPSGRIWFEEICTVQGELSSREVCEGTYNQGRWKEESKSCICRLGDFWINQTCQSLQDVSPEQACESEVNGGRWDQTLDTCICPGLKTWAANVKSCGESALSAASQLCSLSGGRAGSTAGKCLCGSGFRVEVLKLQDYEYCVDEDANDVDIPDWLLILLGILNP